MQCLILRLEGPMLSFGTTIIDANGYVDDFPALSMITGLIGNALGYDRTEAVKLQALQDRLDMAAARLRPGTRLMDFQTAQLAANDKGWTTRGAVEIRKGGAATYNSPHLRYRDFDADACCLIAITLAEGAPSLADIAGALDRPERPLFLGRKPFAPSRRINGGIVDAPNLLDALKRAIGKETEREEQITAQWPDALGERPCARKVQITDQRRWAVDVHGGQRSVWRGPLAVPKRAVENAP